MVLRGITGRFFFGQKKAGTVMTQYRLQTKSQKDLFSLLGFGSGSRFGLHFFSNFR